MSSLPLNPFTQKPMQYEIGTFEFEMQYVSNSTAMDGSDDDSSTEDIDCKEVHVNPRWKDINSAAKMLRVFSPGYKLQTIYVDICFYIRLE